MGDGEWQIEMTWRCTSCRHQNLGRHKECTQCGNPKDASEHYEMPNAGNAAPVVTDPALLRIATSGPNWRCGYCGSDQRRSDGACARCGAAAADGTKPEGPAVPVDASALFNAVFGAAMPSPGQRRTAVAAQRAHTRSAWPGSMVALLVAVPALVCLGAAVAVLGSRGNRGAYVQPAPPPPRDVDAVVERVEWTHTIYVDRYRNRQHEGFAEQRPADATEVRPRGERVHHTDRVQDGFDTEHYTERVQQGFDTEWYSERVACGEDCEPIAQQCRQECAPNGNGFATCRNVCTGGGQRCSPRFCDERRSRQVPHFADVDRTRQVPRFRDEPRMAMWFEWRAWDWSEDRVERASGQGIETRWPEAEAHVGTGLAEGERERARRNAHYLVSLRYDGSRSHTIVPAGETELARFAPGSHHVLRVVEFQAPQLLDPPAPATPMGSD